MPVKDQGARAAGHQALARLLRPVQERLCLGDVVEGSVLLRQRGSGPALGCVNTSCAAGRGPGRAVPGGRLGTGRPALGTRRRASGCFPAGRARWAAVGGGSMRERRFAADGAGGARRGRLPLALPGKAVRSPQRGPDPPGHHLSAWPSSNTDDDKDRPRVSVHLLLDTPHRRRDKVLNYRTLKPLNPPSPTARRVILTTIQPQPGENQGGSWIKDSVSLRGIVRFDVFNRVAVLQTPAAQRRQELRPPPAWPASGGTGAALLPRPCRDVPTTKRDSKIWSLVAVVFKQT